MHLANVKTHTYIHIGAHFITFTHTNAHDELHLLCSHAHEMNKSRIRLLAQQKKLLPCTLCVCVCECVRYCVSSNTCVCVYTCCSMFADCNCCCCRRQTRTIWPAGNCTNEAFFAGSALAPRTRGAATRMTTNQSKPRP